VKDAPFSMAILNPSLSISIFPIPDLETSLNDALRDFNVAI
jgi:hypothetical protein